MAKNEIQLVWRFIMMSIASILIGINIGEGVQLTFYRECVRLFNGVWTNKNITDLYNIIKQYHRSIDVFFVIVCWAFAMGIWYIVEKVILLIIARKKGAIS